MPPRASRNFEAALRLGRRQSPVPHCAVLFQLGEIVRQLLPVLCQFVALLQSGGVLLLIGSAALPGQATDAIRLGVLFLA